jgi:hypothetical protein
MAVGCHPSLVLLTWVVTVFIRPIAKEGPQFIDKAPAYVAQGQAGKGPVGSLIKRYKLAEYVSRNQARLREAGRPCPNAAKSTSGE